MILAYDSSGTENTPWQLTSFYYPIMVVGKSQDVYTKERQYIY